MEVIVIKLFVRLQGTQTFDENQLLAQTFATPHATGFKQHDCKKKYRKSLQDHDCCA